MVMETAVTYRWDGVNLCGVYAEMAIVDGGNPAAMQIKFQSMTCFFHFHFILTL